MNDVQGHKLRTAGIILVILMAGLQLAYAIYAFADPEAFSRLRGTTLFSVGDADWVRIYASRTLFIALIIGYLLYRREFRSLAAAALLGMLMPLTDAILAYQASAGDKVVLKHVATVAFLAVSYLVLRAAVRRERPAAG